MPRFAFELTKLLLTVLLLELEDRVIPSELSLQILLLIVLLELDLISIPEPFSLTMLLLTVFVSEPLMR
ncbi:MAG: hypothetical protein A3G34_09070 [Candidatus Lindowbacteria bacterium RIFCSPLOWO2_12_FULL_62_27]|nr:MAG: hypothetical protein A3G34_09070 [Candidatus Lindowbacteria bacterium RIFCSPLOWO2_12_FULL_62_27]